MKIGLVCPVFNEEVLIRAFIKHWKPRVDDIQIMVSDRPYNSQIKRDNTFEKACSLTKNVVLGSWKRDDKQRNEGLFHLASCDWVITADCDEFMTEDNWQILKRFLETTTHDVVTVNQRPYFKDWENIITDDRWKPVFAVRPSVRFEYIREVDNKNKIHCDATYEHLSWCKPKDIRKKIETYSHNDHFRNDVDIWMDYYDLWQKGDVIFPNCTLPTKKHSLPQEIRRLF